MKATSNIMIRLVFIWALLSAIALAESGPRGGFVRIANGLARGTGPLTIEIDGRNVNANGYKPGAVTGGIGVPSGKHTFRFSRQGISEGNTRITIRPNETTILIPFAEEVPATNQQAAYWTIRVLRLKQHDPVEKRSATFVSVSRNPELRLEMRDPDGRWSPVFVKRLATTRAPILFPRGYVPLRGADGDLASIPIASKGNYVVLLYDDGDGKVRSLNFKDRKFLSAE
jgi:hypothetical protein